MKHILIAIGSTTSQPDAVADNLRQIAEFHGLLNLDRQRPMYAHAEINLEGRNKK